MRYLPLSLMEKIQKLVQAKGENADPRIEIIMQRTGRYIEEGATLIPYTVREGTNCFCFALRRENYLSYPEYVYMIYIDNDGIAKVARQAYVTAIEKKNEWEYLYSLGPAVDVAIEFNGYWVRTSPEAEICFDSPARWTLITEGEPFCFWVTPQGELKVKRGVEGEQTLVSSGVTKVAAIRGWKNVYDWASDQGLICGYIRNGQVCYRAYARQGTNDNPQLPIWELERVVQGIPIPASAVALFRTNDYRVGFLAEVNGEIYWAITERNWAGMAIEDHKVSITASGLLVNLIAVTYENVQHEHKISLTGSDIAIALYEVVYPQIVNIYNPDLNTTTIILESDMELQTSASEWWNAFTVTDEENTVYPVTTGVLSGNTITLRVADFANAAGDLTISYSSVAGQLGTMLEFDFWAELKDFIKSFTPQLPVITEPPEVEAIWNE